MADPARDDYPVERRSLAWTCYFAIDCGRSFELSQKTLYRKVATYARMEAELAGAHLGPSVSLANPCIRSPRGASRGELREARLY